MDDLRVVYDGGKVDRKLDDALEKVLKQFGLTRWASGCDLRSGKRDLVFERIKKKG